MIGDDAMARLLRTVRIDAGGAGDRGHQSAHQIDIENRRHALQQGRIRSSPMPVSIDGRGSPTRSPGAICSYCMKTRFQNSRNRIAVLVRTAGRAARKFLPPVEENLGARTARAGVAHLPEIIGTRDPDDL